MESSNPALADSERIQRVIVNFVNNAVKYAPSSQEILIRVSRKPGKVRLSVIDKAPGIAAIRCLMYLSAFTGPTKKAGSTPAWDLDYIYA
jgi:K+-sensing histidine kinase KdpD